MDDKKAEDANAPVLPEGFMIVPKEPTRGLLVSMAIRWDHGLGIPGYYDKGLHQLSGLTHKQRLLSAINLMRQLYQEATGQGFYSPDAESRYSELMDVTATPSPGAPHDPA